MHFVYTVFPRKLLLIVLLSKHFISYCLISSFPYMDFLSLFFIPHFYSLPLSLQMGHLAAKKEERRVRCGWNSGSEERKGSPAAVDASLAHGYRNTVYTTGFQESTGMCELASTPRYCVLRSVIVLCLQ